MSINISRQHEIGRILRPYNWNILIKYFTILEPRTPEICGLYLVQKRHLTDSKVLKLSNVRSGCSLDTCILKTRMIMTHTCKERRKFPSKTLYCFPFLIILFILYLPSLYHTIMSLSPSILCLMSDLPGDHTSLLAILFLSLLRSAWGFHFFHLLSFSFL